MEAWSDRPFFASASRMLAGMFFFASTLTAFCLPTALSKLLPQQMRLDEGAKFVNHDSPKIKSKYRVFILNTIKFDHKILSIYIKSLLLVRPARVNLGGL